MLTKFFFGLSKNDLFIHGSRYDRYIMIFFGPLLWSFTIVRFLVPRIWIILILDQVSRHIYRNNKDSIEYYTRQILPYIKDLNEKDLDAMSIEELAFTSLAIRHLLRISQKSQNLPVISRQMELFIKVIDKRLELCMTPVTSAIHSHNKSASRRYRFIEADYQCWSVVPQISYKDTYFTDFLKTEISQYVVQTTERLIDLEKPATIYIMCSGGIDSMTLLRIYNGLRLKNTFSNLTYKALHINWNYRNESRLERDQLEEVFIKWNLDYLIVDAPIDPNDPNWNRKSTDFRFELFKNLSEKQKSYFCLGHIITDMIENLICNVCLEGSSTGKQTYFNLFGMQELGKGTSITRSDNKKRFYLFRPLLLHKKPVVLDTPFFKDNATHFDIKRRIIRRLLKDFKFDQSRIRSVYQEAYELRQKYRLESQTAFTYDPNWTMSEWREIFNNFGGLRKGVIRDLMRKLKTKESFELKCNNQVVTVQDKKIKLFYNSFT